MTTERLRASALPRALSDIVVDVADLVQKEMRLARVEIGDKLSNKLRAGAWMLIAAAMALIALFMLVEGLALWIANFGISSPTSAYRCTRPIGSSGRRWLCCQRSPISVAEQTREKASHQNVQFTKSTKT